MRRLRIYVIILFLKPESTLSKSNVLSALGRYATPPYTLIYIIFTKKKGDLQTVN